MEYLAHSSKGDIPEQSYTEHIVNVIGMAVKNARTAARYYSCDKDLLTNFAEICAYYHDLGKLEIENQEVLHGICSHTALPINHVDAGTAAVKLRFPGNFLPASIIYSHHRGLPDFPTEGARKKNCFRDQDHSVRNHTDVNLSKLLQIHESLMDHKLSECNLKSIQSDPDVFIRILLSCLADADHTDTACHYGNFPDEIDGPDLKAKERLAQLDAYVSKLGKKSDERNILRTQMYRNCRDSLPEENIVACDSPVGTGKTTSVMAHLLHQAQIRGSRRIFVILPFTNIISQSVEVYRKALVLPGEDPEEVVAELHHRADFEKEETRKLTAQWRAPIIVTTAVAFFETMSSNRPSSLRRLHELPGSVIFLDEAHAALPVKLLALAWKWMQTFADEWGCYWVLASGSLVKFWTIHDITQNVRNVPQIVKNDLRNQLSQYEHRRIEFPWISEPISRKKLIECILDSPGPRLVIMNTVQSAAVVAKDLLGIFEQKYGSNDYLRRRVFHLSTALNAEDRSVVINEVKKQLRQKNNSDWVLVATSCVEAGVDFSFHTGFREIASLTSLLQASGRINRSGEYEDSAIWSFSMQDDDLLKINPALSDSEYVLARYFQKGEKITPELCTQAITDELNRKLVSDIIRFLDKAERSLSFAEVESRFTVIDSDTVPVIADEELKRKIIAGACNWKDIQKKAIMVRRYWVSLLNLSELIDGIYEWNRPYSEFLGIMEGILNLKKI